MLVACDLLGDEFFDLEKPFVRSCREQILERKRREYRDLVPEYYDIDVAERSEDDNCALRQVCAPVGLIPFTCSLLLSHWLLS